jgi:hypothetical protein
MTTALAKTLKREVKVKGRAFVVTISPEGLAVTPKGRRKGQRLRWEDLVSGDAALATALNATLSQIPPGDDAGAKRKATARST